MPPHELVVKLAYCRCVECLVPINHRCRVSCKSALDIDVSACPCEFDHKIIELGDDNEDCLVNGKLDSVVRVGFVTEHDVAPLVFTGRMPD